MYSRMKRFKNTALEIIQMYLQIKAIEKTKPWSSQPCQYSVQQKKPELASVSIRGRLMGATHN